jgi:hypothetical protein
MIRTLMVSTSYPSDASDWRGVFIRSLAEALARRPDVSLRLWSPPGEMPAALDYVATASERAWLARLMEAGGISHLVRQGGWRGLTAPLRLLSMLRAAYRRQRDVDLYHVNWLQNALVLPRNGRPLLMSALGNDLQLLRVPGVRMLLRRICRSRAVAICPNAEWMVPVLESAFGDCATVVPVVFGIDPRWYALRRAPRQHGAAHWLCITRLTRAKLGPLFEWCRPSFEGSARTLHLFGPMQEPTDIPDWVEYHGPATPESLLQDWFPMASGLITLSRHAEGRPQVMLEAMAAGLPIIASDLPAHASLLRDRETGWLCNSVEGFAHALEALEVDALNTTIGDAARAWAAGQIGSWDDCAARYVQVYRMLLERSSP